MLVMAPSLFGAVLPTMPPAFETLLPNDIVTETGEVVSWVIQAPCSSSPTMPPIDEELSPVACIETVVELNPSVAVSLVRSPTKPPTAVALPPKVILVFSGTYSIDAAAVPAKPPTPETLLPIVKVVVTDPPSSVKRAELANRPTTPPTALTPPFAADIDAVTLPI